MRDFDPSELRPPGLLGYVAESRTMASFPRLALQWRRLSGLGRGGGEPVLVLPGFGAGDGSTRVLCSLIGRWGYRVAGWGLGVNRGDVPNLIPRVAERVQEIHRSSGQAVRLVGWSLGGVLAREVARDEPELVDRIVTLGSPVVGGPKFTNAASFYTATGQDLDAIDDAVAERNQIPIRVPITAVFSRADGVVDWRACIDSFSEQVEHVEVKSSHLGLGFDPEVLEIVADRLAASKS